MQVSQLYFDLVTHFEGLKLNAYQCSAGHWTIGIGSITYPNGKKVQKGDVCTKEQAYEYLQSHTDGVQKYFNNSYAFSKLKQCEYDACVDLAYNIGIGAFNESTLKKRIISGEGSIEDAFLMWNKANVGGKLQVLDGLTRRRKCEAYLYANGVNHPTFYL